MVSVLFVKLRTFLLLAIFFSLGAVANKPNESRKAFDSSVDEIHRRLLAYKDDPFGTEDTWAALSDPQRKLWTAANEVVRLPLGIRGVLKRAAAIRTNKISLHVDVHIVAAEKDLSREKREQITQYASGMRAGHAGIALTFNVSLAPVTLFERISMHNASAHPSEFAAILEQTAATLGARNVLFVIVDPRGEPGSQVGSHLPFVGSGRVSWIVYNVHLAHGLDVSSLLLTAERAAERVYAPKPLYFPVPLVRQLRIELAAFTPGYEHRALWLQKFAWDQFETAVRTVAVRGQNVRFFSSQANAECPNCEQAFHDVERYERDFPNRAAKVLNNDQAPTEAWASGIFSTSTRKRRPPDTFRLYVLDTTKLRKSDYLQRLERRMLTVYPGMGLVTFRSSDQVALAKLESHLLKAMVASVYGIAEPDLYMHSKLDRHVSKQTKRPALVLFDVVIRNLVSSGVQRHLSELNEIVEGILYFSVDPSKSLGEDTYVRLMQRVNLLLFKLDRAQYILGDSGDTSAALHLVSSASHEIRAIRNAFDISTDEDSFDRFRDPTLRCHFSRLRREALKASQIFESRGPQVKRLAWAMLSFSMTVILAYAALSRDIRRKMRGKRE